MKVWCFVSALHTCIDAAERPRSETQPEWRRRRKPMRSCAQLDGTWVGGKETEREIQQKDMTYNRVMAPERPRAFWAFLIQDVNGFCNRCSVLSLGAQSGTSKNAVKRNALKQWFYDVAELLWVVSTCRVFFLFTSLQTCRGRFHATCCPTAGGTWKHKWQTYVFNRGFISFAFIPASNFSAQGLAKAYQFSALPETCFDSWQVFICSPNSILQCLTDMMIQLACFELSGPCFATISANMWLLWWWASTTVHLCLTTQPLQQVAFRNVFSGFRSMYVI